MKLLEIKDTRLRRMKGDNYELFIRRLGVEAGEHVAIVGPSGCGKSTTLDLIGMILEPDESEQFELNFTDEYYNVSELWKKGKINILTDIRRRYFGYVLQTGELFTFLNVRENIELAAQTNGFSRAESAHTADDLMQKLNITHLQNKKPGKLSIGERQRVAIARALAPKPKILLADEPTSALDPGLSRKVMKLFLAAATDYKAAIIMVTHDLNLAREFNFREVPITTETSENGIIAILDDGHA